MRKNQNHFSLVDGVNVICASAFILLIYVRIYLGVDFTDESQYVGQVMMLINGGKAFVHDLFYQQTSSWLLFPFVKLLIHFQGNSDGVFLLVRHIYFFFSLSCSAFVFFMIRRSLPKEFHLLCLINFLFIPFSLPSISYNTLAFNLMFVICCLTLVALQKDKRTNLFPLTLVLLVTASFFYPTLIFILFLYLAYLFFYLPKNAFYRSLLATSLTAFFWIFLVFLFNPNPEDLKASLLFTGLHGALRPLSETADNFFTLLIPSTIAWVFPPIVFVLKRFGLSKYLFFSTVTLAMAQTWSSRTNLIFTNNFFILALSSGALWSLLLYRKEKKGAMKVAILTIFVALLVSFTSSNGFSNASFGLSSLLLILAFTLPTTPKKIANLLSSIIICAVLVYGDYSFFYREQGYTYLTQRITTSPFRGLYTSPQKAAFLEKLDSEIKSFPATSHVFSFYFFPAVYTWFQVFPQTNTLFNFYSCLVANNEKLIFFSNQQLRDLSQADFVIYSPRMDFFDTSPIPCATNFSQKIFENNLTLQEDLNFVKIYKRK